MIHDIPDAVLTAFAASWGLRAFTIFLAMALLDFVWARYTIACADRRAVYAGITAVFIYGLSGFLTINYVADPWLLAPLGCGAFVGTWSSIRFHSPKAGT